MVYTNIVPVLDNNTSTGMATRTGESNVLSIVIDGFKYLPSSNLYQGIVSGLF